MKINKKPSASCLVFHITIIMKPQKKFLYKNSSKKKLSANFIINSLVVNVDNDSSIANSHQLEFKKDQSTSRENTSEAFIIAKNISDKNKIKHGVNNTANCSLLGFPVDVD